jgi:hypothetical protein
MTWGIPKKKWQSSGIGVRSVGMKKVLSIKNPWAYFIIYGFEEMAGQKIKDVENRTWYTDYRGPLLIHCSKKVDAGIPCDELPHGVNWQDYNECIIGQVNLVECVKNSKSPWAENGLWHWVLKDPTPCKPIPVKGSLGLWEYTGEIMEITKKEAK